MEKNRDKEIVKMAIKNFGCGKSYDYEDIFQTGYLGLLLAKQQYKKEKTTNPEDLDFTAFAKYAVPFIRGFLIRELQNNDELVRKPVYIKEQKRRYERSGMSVADFLEEEGKTRRSGNAWTDNQKLFESSMFNLSQIARESGCSRQNIWSKRKVAMEQLRRKHVLKKTNRLFIKKSCRNHGSFFIFCFPHIYKYQKKGGQQYDCE